MHYYRKHRVAFLTAALLCALLVVLGFVVLLTARVDVSFGDSSNHFMTYADIIIVFFGAIQSVFLFGSLIAFWLRARADGVQKSVLLMPLIAVKLGIAAVLLLSAAISFDLLSHHLKPHWQAFYTPSLHVAQNLLLLGTIFALSWLHLRFLAAWGWTGRRIGWLLAAMLMTTVATVTLAYLVASLSH